MAGERDLSGEAARGNPAPAAAESRPASRSSSKRGHATQIAEKRRGSHRPQPGDPASTPHPERCSPAAPRPEPKRPRRAPGRGAGEGPSAGCVRPRPHPRGGGGRAVPTLARPPAATRCWELGAGKACGGTFSILAARAAACAPAGGRSAPAQGAGAVGGARPRAGFRRGGSGPPVPARPRRRARVSVEPAWG